ncbi:group II intron maturase-specific domain-containing protein [Paraburkholderia caribensis]|uniref:Group II intron maturase-specific domain-containing protein n=1 Tax=Paraburkholderia caribensis TaxID=75105 RepID=A0ABV0EAD5_9BURK|nr:group II intron maturase-specific domain-containing protein [Paraburkholderia caribensis]
MGHVSSTQRGESHFSLVDSHIWRLLWRWALRRHPSKGAQWVKDRYFRSDGRRSWVFATKGSADSNTDGVRLFHSNMVAITRHTKIRAQANPFDSMWDAYFARRRTAKRSAGLPGATPWC